MARKSLRTADSLTGNRIAFEDLVALDESGNPVVGEYVLFGSKACLSNQFVFKRGISSGLTGADTFDVTSLPNELLANLVPVNDGTMLVVFVEQSTTGGTATISPIAYDSHDGLSWIQNTAYTKGTIVKPIAGSNGFTYECTTAGTSHATVEPTWPLTPGDTVSDGTAVWTCRLPGQVITVLPSKIFTQPYAFRRGAAAGNYLTVVMFWDVSGFRNIGIHLSAISGAANAVKIGAFVI